MRASKWVAMTLAIALASTAMSACGILRTPYERQKIQENGGSAKKPNEEQSANAGGGGQGEGGGGGGAQTAGKQKKEDPQIAKEKKEGEKDKGESESTGQRKERLKGQGLLYVLPDAKERLEKLRPGAEEQAERAKTKGEEQAKKPVKEVQLHHSGPMSAAVSKLEGVVEAIVLLDERGHAFVALNEDQKVTSKMVKAPREANERIDVKTEGDIPQPIQERIAKKLRAIDPHIGTVHITNSADHVKKFQRYAGQVVKGDIDETAHAAADHITDIWK